MSRRSKRTGDPADVADLVGETMSTAYVERLGPAEGSALGELAGSVPGPADAVIATAAAGPGAFTEPGTVTGRLVVRR